MNKNNDRWSEWRRRYNAVTRPLGTRCDPETREEVDAYAKENKISVGEAIRRLVDLGLECERAATRSDKPPPPLHQPSLRR